MDGERMPLVSRGGTRSRLPDKTRTQLACAAVLATETFERIAFYGIVGNLVMFLNHNPFLWLSYDAASALFIYTGLSYITSIFGGWLADTVLGRFKAILLFFVIYMAGYVFFPVLAYWPQYKNDTAPGWCSSNSINETGDTYLKNVTFHDVTASEEKNIIGATGAPLTPEINTCSWAVYLALVIMAVGNGCVKANIAPFGADQVQRSGLASTRSFFNIFYWCINVGALIALGPLAWIQQEVSFFYGYIGTFSCLFVAACVFFIGGSVYTMKLPTGSVLTNIGKVICEACRTHRQQNLCQENHTAMHSSVAETVRPTSWIDAAKVRYGGSFHDNMVEDVKTLGKIFLVFLALVPYWIVYFQMQTTFLVQGLHMRLDFNTHHKDKITPRDICHHTKSFQFPAASLSLFDVLFLIILIPVMDRLVYPCLDRRGVHLSLRIRIIIGMVFSMLAVGAAGLVESQRLNIFWKNNTQNVYPQWIGHSCYHAADMTVMWQVPQYALIGVSEAFASVAGLELAYITAPRSMQGLIMGIFWLSQGVGSMLGGAIMFAFHNTLFFDSDHGDINCRVHCPWDKSQDCACHLDYYYYFLVGLQFLGIVSFVIIVWCLNMGGPSQARQYTSQSSTSPTVEHSDNSVASPVKTHVQCEQAPVSSVSVDSVDLIT